MHRLSSIIKSLVPEGTAVECRDGMVLVTKTWPRKRGRHTLEFYWERGGWKVTVYPEGGGDVSYYSSRLRPFRADQVARLRKFLADPLVWFLKQRRPAGRPRRLAGEG